MYKGGGFLGGETNVAINTVGDHRFSGSKSTKTNLVGGWMSWRKRQQQKGGRPNPILNDSYKEGRLLAKVRTRMALKWLFKPERRRRCSFGLWNYFYSVKRKPLGPSLDINHKGLSNFTPNVAILLKEEEEQSLCFKIQFFLVCGLPCM